MSDQDRVTKRGGRNATRPRPLPPDVTARNLAYEKQRRQTFNEDLVNLARLVPALAQARRLSKVLIVNESIRHLRQRRNLCISAARDMRDLLMENSRLASELNALRAQVGGLAMASVQPKAATEAMVQLMDIENEEAGEFPEGFGQTWAGRSSSPSKHKNAQSRNGLGPASESASPNQGGGYHTQPPVHNARIQLDNSDSSIPRLYQHPQNIWDACPSLGGQLDASLRPGSGLFEPTNTISSNHMPKNTPELFVEPIDALLMDDLPKSWTESLSLDLPDLGNISSSNQEGNTSFEELWDF